jgi:hypothetical protein
MMRASGGGGGAGPGGRNAVDIPAKATSSLGIDRAQSQYLTHLMLIVRCRVWAVVIPNIANKGVSCVSGGQERRCCGAPQLGPPFESTRAVVRVGGTVGRGVAITLKLQFSVARNENGSSEQLGSVGRT